MSNTRRTSKPRKPQISPHSGEGRALGLDDRHIPGGLEHIHNTEVPGGKPNVPAERHIKDSEAHGVPPEDPDKPYAKPEAGKILLPQPEPLPDIETAVPVYIIEQSGKGKVHRTSLCDTKLIPATGNDPVRLCSRDDNRVAVHLLNEDTANDVRFAEDRATLVEGRGALLSHFSNSYVEVPTQDELYAIGTGATAVSVSVVQVTEVNG